MLPARNESEATSRVRGVLCAHLSELIAGAVLETALRRVGCLASTLQLGDIPLLLEALEHGSQLFLNSPTKVGALMKELSRLSLVHPVSETLAVAARHSEKPPAGAPQSPEERGLASGSYPVARPARGAPTSPPAPLVPAAPAIPPPSPSQSAPAPSSLPSAPRGSDRGETPLLTAASLGRLLVRGEEDIVVARGAARHAAEQVGVSLGYQTLVAAVVSELARNLVRYAGGGDIELTALCKPHRGLDIVARDRGPGIADQEHALQGGRDAALRGIERVASYFHVRSTTGQGATVSLQLRER